jgi:hypothetical protein
MSYCVYLKRRQDLPGEPVARLIASLPGLSLADGQQLVRRCRGFLIEHLEPSAANILVERLREIQVDAECRQMRELVPNPRPVVVHGGAFRESGCTIQDWKSEDTLLQWEDIYLMSVCRLQELELPDSVKKNLKTGGFGEAGVERQDEPRKAFLLDFYVSEPRAHYRIQSSEFRYDYLGGRMGRSAVANFAVLLHDFDKHAAAAHRDEGFRAALAGEWERVPSSTAIYEVDEYHRWLLQTYPGQGRGTFSGETRNK